MQDNAFTAPDNTDTEAQDLSTSVFDFTHYYIHSLSVFLEDYNLSMEDLTRTAPHNYNTKKPIPLLDTAACCQLVCGMEDEILMINLWFEAEVRTGAEASADFQQLQHFRNYFNTLENALFLNDLEEFRPKAPNINTYKTPEELEAAICEYTNTPPEERSSFAFTLKGYWNLPEDVQIQMAYRFIPETQNGIIYLTLRNSKTDHAMQPDGTLVVPEDASLFTVPGQNTEPGPAADHSINKDLEGTFDTDSHSLQWSLPKQTLKQTFEFSVEEEGQISVNLSVMPSDKTVKFGIINSAGERNYLTGNDIINHIFTVPAAGNYRIFIENQDTDEVEVQGFYRIF